jgi:N-acylneuraminate cytidylyltransferase
METLIAIVPMKGHSERIPGKNIRLFNGKPLCHWILNTLGRVKSIKRIVVDTDSLLIAQKVGEYPGVEVSMRPEQLRGDFVSVNRLIEYVISLYQGHHFFLQTHSTNPLLKKETIETAVETFFNLKEYDSLFSVNRYQSRFYDHRFRPVNHDPGELKRTQDLPPLYEENSNIYLFSRESFHAVRARVGRKPYLFEMDPLEAIDIDEEKDFVLAETLMKQRLV